MGWPEPVLLESAQYRTRAFVRQARGGPERQILDSVAARGFFPVEKGIYFLTKAGADAVWPLQFFDLAAGTSRVIDRVEGQLGQGFTVSPERSTLLFTVDKPLNYDLMLVENFR